MLSRKDRLHPRAVKTVMDATLYSADLQPVGQLHFTLVPYINRGKTIIMSRLNMLLSNQEREEILSMWFDKVVGLMLQGINCIRRWEKQKQASANGCLLTREFHNLYSSVDITWPVKVRKVRFSACAICMRGEE